LRFFFLGVPVINSTGSYSPVTELWIKIRGESDDSRQLREDTKAKYQAMKSGSKGEEFEENIA